MNKCPKCGHEWHDEKRASGGKARWQGMSKSERAQAASDAAKARWAKTKRKPKRAAVRLNGQAEPRAVNKLKI
jgi:hypothetical protein